MARVALNLVGSSPVAASLAEQLKAAAALDPAYPAERFAGRGIVICAGGARFFTCAWVAIGLLRRQLGCTLPIEVWYLGSEEMGPAMQALLRAQGVDLVDAFEVAKTRKAERFDGWELKTYAISHSRFREVLLLDADNVPVADPAFLFDEPAYQATGALFWPDIVRLGRTNEIWAVSGLPPWDGPSFEAGQLVIDKARCWPALQLAFWMNQRAADFYRFLYGDKDTFLIAWQLTGTEFTQIPHAPRLLEATICQRAPDSAVLFQHRGQAKWLLTGANPVIDGFLYEPECRRLLDELALLWDGHVYNPPPRSATCQSIEAGMVRQGRFRLTLLGDAELDLLFTADHCAREGERLRYYWHVEDGADGPVLALHFAALRFASLVPDQDGAWHGRHLRAPPTSAVLCPSPPPIFLQHWDDEPAQRLVEAIVALYQTLPQDAEIVRDCLGTIRTLQLLWPDAVARLVAAAPSLAALAAEAGAGRAPATRSPTIPRRSFASYDYVRQT
jgi:Mannosyltransferase putative